MEKSRSDKVPDLPSFMPPRQLDEDWIRWMIGEWESAGESDNGPFKNWVKARGLLKVEMGLCGQFLMMWKTGGAAELSDEYAGYLKKTMGAGDQYIEGLRKSRFANLELQTIDPGTGGIIGYLFDSWRCVAAGSGSREKNIETMEWKWSAAGRGSSRRITEKLDNDRFIITENYILPDGGVMEDRTRMTRRR
jgi:hypothetical protein